MGVDTGIHSRAAGIADIDAVVYRHRRTEIAKIYGVRIFFVGVHDISPC